MIPPDAAKKAFADAAQPTLATSGPMAWTPWTAQEFAMLLSASHPHYRIQAFVDRGGMGAVYQATDSRSGRHVAIKVMQPGLGAEYVERFQREIQILRGLSHPRIIAILDRGLTAGGSPFLVMPFLEGRSLAQLIASGQRLPMPRLLQLVQQLCDGIAHAHERGIIHRDLKPANIFLTAPDDSAVILDFGIARLLVSTDGLHTQTGLTLGTQGYLAPEVRQGRKAEKTADIFSLGVILYQMLTGQLPEGNYAQPSSFGLDPRFDSILAKALHNDPERRYGSPQELAQVVIKLSGSYAHDPFWGALNKIGKLKIAAALLVLLGACLAFQKVSDLATRHSESQRNEARLVQERKFRLLEKLSENRLERLRFEATYADCIQKESGIKNMAETIKKEKEPNGLVKIMGAIAAVDHIADRVENQQRWTQYNAEKLRIDREAEMLKRELETIQSGGTTD